MEYLIGESLDRLLKRVPYLPPAQVVSLGWQVADALAYAHTRHRLVHRDIKPGNLFLMQNGTIRILDFGVAAIMVDFKLATTRIGTPEYMPYEQASGQADYRSDIYGLGASLYHLGTGRLAPPFGIDAPIPPRTFNREITPALEQVLLKALQREPAARYQTAIEMRDALHRTWREYDLPKQAFTKPRSDTLLIESPGTPVPPQLQPIGHNADSTGWAVMLGVGLVIVPIGGFPSLLSFF